MSELNHAEAEAKTMGSPTPRIALSDILVPVDFSPDSQRSLSFAAAVATQFRSRIHLLHVVELPATPQWGYAQIPFREAKRRRDAEHRLRLLTQEESRIHPELIASVETRVGDAAGEICSAAKETPIHLIALAEHGRKHLRHPILGSTAERVAARAPCPVLILRDRILTGTEGTARVAPQRIMVTTDFSDLSRIALPYAAAFARRFGAELLLLHAAPSHLPADLSHLGIVFDEQRALRQARADLPLLRQTELPPDLNVEARVVRGDAAREICFAAASGQIDLIIMATHGRTGLKHLALGSVAERVIRRAPCPVLVVRESEREFLRDAKEPA